MSVGFRAVQWNRAKITYDLVLAAGVALYLGVFMTASIAAQAPGAPIDWTDLRLKAFGSCAFLMLSVILCIGPLARLSPSSLPLLYNRRHFGVAMAVMAALHGWSMFEWYIGLGVLPSLLDELGNPAAYASFIGFPFKVLGMIALAILLVMAATSHDYWQHYLSPLVWKGLHMAVYAAYGLVVMHVALGVLQKPAGVFMPALAFGSLAVVGTLHVLAGWREFGADGTEDAPAWIALFPPASIADKAARIITVGGETGGGERIAVFRDGAMVSAVTNLCAHQQGPLGEGRVVDGCITCPWHGYQYRLSDGCAPAPFTEKLATYRLRLRNGMLELDPRPLAPGTPAAITLPGP